MKKQGNIGNIILNDHIYKFFNKDFTSIYKELIKELCISNSTLYLRLPYLAAFGYNQGHLFHLLRTSSNNNIVNLATSILNIGICFFDYIIDHLKKKPKFSIL